jgi:hypothetical protein
MDASRAASEHESFVQKYGPGVARRFGDLKARLTGAATAGRATRLDAATPSRRGCRRIVRGGARGLGPLRRGGRRAEAVEARAPRSSRRPSGCMAGDAGHRDRRAGRAGRGRLPPAHAPARLAGTPLARLAARASAYDREVHATVVPMGRCPAPASAPAPGAVPASGPTPAPGTPGIPPTPSAPPASAVARAKVEAFLADAETKIAARRYAEAAALEQARR